MKPDPERKDGWCIQLKNCDYAGIIYRYGKFWIDEPEDTSEDAKCRFEYDIISVPDNLEDKEITEEAKNEMENLIGDIVVEILEDYYS